VIRPQNAPTIFSTEERFQQLNDSIRSVRGKIPECFVVVLEGSSYTDDQIKSVMQSGAHEIVHTNVDGCDKQAGESSLLRTYFGSSKFSDLRNKHNILSISKLSGRYALTDDFVFYYDGETCICKMTEPETSYSGHGYLYTRYYSFPIRYLDTYLQGLDKCCHNGIFIDIEHSFYSYQAIPLDKINREKQKINVAGRFAPTGEYVED
jgi:hypothetical protein